MALLAHAQGVPPDLGFGITLDDVGTGHAALALVRALPFGRLKVHETHVHALVGDDPEAATFAEIVLRMGTSLGLDVVAEGVETAEQREATLRHGCGYAQGRLFADALSNADLVAFLRDTA